MRFNKKYFYRFNTIALLGTSLTTGCLQKTELKTSSAKGGQQQLAGQTITATPPARAPTVLPPAATAAKAKVSLGYNHACALVDSAVQCWGSNAWGQLGNGLWFSQTGEPSNKNVPGSVIGLSSGVSAISLGGYHSCALLNSGEVKCWGYNFMGQLGNNADQYANNGHSSVPVGVLGLESGITQLAAGFNHTCAISAAGALFCWGENSNGQIGNNSKVHVRTAVKIIASGVKQVVVGRSHTCAMLTDSSVKCWGTYHYGQDLQKSESDSLVPTNIAAFANVTGLVSNAYNTCAVSAGNAICLGRTASGHPERVNGLSSVSSIAIGLLHTCATMTDGEIKCFGDNSMGQLGKNPSIVVALENPTTIFDAASGVKDLIANGFQTCVNKDQKIKCFGSNRSGELGTGNNVSSFAPVAIVAPWN